MKNLIFITILCSLFSTFAQKKSDFTYDAKNSSVIPNYLGEVKLLKGQAQAIGSNKKSRTLKIKDKIYPSEIVKTAANSFLKIEMVDTTSVTLGKNSEMNFENFKYRTKSDRSMSLRLIKGRMRSHFKIKAKSDDDLKVHIGHVSMGVRGTKILGNAATLSDGRKYASAAIIQGQVKAYDSLYDEMMMLESGQEYFSVTGNQNVKKTNKKMKMDDAELKYYRALDTDPNKFFRPMLKYAKGYIIRNNSAPNEQIQNSPSSSNGLKKDKNTNESPEAWKNTLKKLNKTLKENNSEQ
jgi:hypothetical protein